MTRRILSTILLLSFVITLTSSVQARESPAGVEAALVYIKIQSPSDIERFEATGLPAYTRLQGHEPQDYLLSGVYAADQALLSQEGLTYHVLDANMRGASYYLVYAMPGRQINWGDYGQLLLDDGVQVLLRTTTHQARQLAQAGAELRAVTTDPKPLRPTAPTINFPTVIDPDSEIEEMINQVNSTIVNYYTGGLAGNWPVSVGGELYTITTRDTYSGEPIQKATQWSGEHLANRGLDVEYQQWGGDTYPNVIGELTGLISPGNIYIIGGHLDDVPGTPGADDNASGSVAALIAADILSQYQWDCTLRFALWTGEEQGLWGSHEYAERSSQLGENILGYLNLDMISYNTIDSPPDIDLIYNPTMPLTLELAQLFADVVDAYSLNLIPELITDLSGGSDHSSFWEYGYTAILGIEDQSDFNPNYHGPGDTLANQNLPYYTEFVKAALGTFAHMSKTTYGVNLSVDETKAGLPGETVTYTLSLTNTGNCSPDSFDISLGTSIFTSTVSATTIGPLNPGETDTFQVYVQIPENALLGESDAVEVTAISQSDEGKADIATLTTLVGSYGVMLDSDQTEGSGPPGDTLTYTVQMTNTGSLKDTIVLTYSQVNTGWMVNLVKDNFELQAGESAEVSLNVVIPYDAIAGDWDTFILQATSSHDPSKENEIQLTTTVSEPCAPVTGIDFTWSPMQAEAGEEITFTATASGTAPISYTWDFDDDGTGVSEQVLHTYAAGGVYTVSLTASNACGQGSTSHAVTVLPVLQVYLPVISSTNP